MRKYPNVDLEIESKFKNCLVNDIETTGLVIGKAEVLTSAMICCDYETMKPIGARLFRFRPRFPKVWEAGAEKVHGITLDEAMTFPEAHIAAEEMIVWLEETLGKGPHPFMCHALKPFKQGESYFDYGHLRCLYYDMGLDKMIDGGHTRWENLFPHRHVQSTVEWSKALKADGIIETENNKLDTLCGKFGIHLDHHNAVSDAKACRELILKFRSL